MSNRRFSNIDNALKVERPNMLEFISDKDGLTFTYEDIKKTETEFYAKGFGEGIELGISQGEMRAIREIDIAVQEILLQISQYLQVVVDQEREFHANFFNNIVRICKVVLDKSMPHFYMVRGKEEMENLLKDVIESMIVSVPIKVKVSERLYEHLYKRMDSLCSAYSETIEIAKDENLSDSACEVEWLGGGAKWDMDKRYQQIKEKLEFYLNAYIV
jgi:flagellar biosynthesis/type III secretory pathway protein FliH